MANDRALIIRLAPTTEAQVRDIARRYRINTDEAIALCVERTTRAVARMERHYADNLDMAFWEWALLEPRGPIN